MAGSSKLSARGVVCSNRVSRSTIEQKAGHIGAGVAPDRVGGGLGDGDGRQVDIGVEDALGVLGQRFGQGAAVRAVDLGEAAAALQQLLLDRGLAEQLEGGVADDRAGGQNEYLPFDGV